MTFRMEGKFIAMTRGSCPGMGYEKIIEYVNLLLGCTVGVRYKVQEGARYKVQEGVLYKIQSPFFRQIFPEGALYKVQW